MPGECYLSDCIVPTVELPVGCSASFGLRPLSPVKGNLNVSACQDISDSVIASTFVATVWRRPKWQCPSAQNKDHKDSSQLSVEDLDMSAQGPDLKPTEHLRDELEWRLRARPSCATSLPNPINVLQNEWAQIPTETLQKLVESLLQRKEAVMVIKVGSTSY